MFKGVVNFVKDIYDDPFSRYVSLVLIIIGVVLLTQPFFSSTTDVCDADCPAFVELNDSVSTLLEQDGIHYFFSPTCPHCAEQKKVNERLEQELGVEIIKHDITQPGNSELLIAFAQHHNISRAHLGVPATFFGDYYNIGFESEASTGKELEAAMSAYARGEQVKAEGTFDGEVDLPFIGRVSVFDYSLPALAIILGLVDGFNPCAMWVLVVLISLVMGLQDKKRIWIIVGSFVAASGILYFLFMTAWLNVFLYIGYLQPLTIIVGLIALGIGVIDLKKFFLKEEEVCKVGDASKKQRTVNRMKQIVHAPLTWTTIFGIITLAFIVNSIEFACSFALPLIFTETLAISNLSTMQYYGYILLYDLFFMFDDLVIFGLAAFAVQSSVGTKYARYCKLIGGIVLVLLGIVLAFFPEVLALIG